MTMPVTYYIIFSQLVTRQPRGDMAQKVRFNTIALTLCVLSYILVVDPQVAKAKPHMGQDNENSLIEPRAQLLPQLPKSLIRILVKVILFKVPDLVHRPIAAKIVPR